MALLKQIPLAANPAWAAGYIHIEQAAYNRRERVLEIVLGLYPDKLAAQNELPPLETRVVRVHGDEADMPIASLHDAAAALLYAFVKTEEGEFADATDAL